MLPILGEKSLSIREPGSVPSLARLGLIVGSILIGVVLLFHVRYSSNTISLAPKSSTAAVAQVNHPAKLQSQATSSPRFATAIAPDQALADSGALSNSTTDLRMAEKLMVPAPPQTDHTLQGVDPRRLRASFQRGMAAKLTSSAPSLVVASLSLLCIAAMPR